MVTNMSLIWAVFGQYADAGSTTTGDVHDERRRGYGRAKDDRITAVLSKAQGFSMSQPREISQGTCAEVIGT